MATGTSRDSSLSARFVGPDSNSLVLSMQHRLEELCVRISTVHCRYLGTYITLIFYLVVSDIDECAVDEKNHCSHTCENTFGGYVCSCPSSYQKLGSDNRTCQCIPHGVFAFFECIVIVLDQCTPPCGSSQTCTNYNRCVCPKGYFGYRDCLIGETDFV